MTDAALRQGTIIEGQTLEGVVRFDCDILVIGSGPGGAVAAATLQAAGKKVLILEEGGYFTEQRFRMHESDAYVHLYQDGAQRVTKDLSVALYQGRAVGGSSVVNWTTCFRLRKRVHEHWLKVHHIAGFSEADLRTHYTAVEERLGVHKVARSDLNRNNALLLEGCEKLGFEVDTLSRNVRGCARTGYCGLGCPIGAKQSMRKTYLQDALHSGATLISRARVDRLEYRSGRALGAQANFLDALGTNMTGATLEVRANRIIVAAGALGSPALLLRSGIDLDGKVGERTFIHPTVALVGQHKDPVHPYYGAPQTVASEHFVERGGEVGFLLEAAPLQPSFFATGISGYGEAHRSKMESLAHSQAILGIHIDGFRADEKGGRVMLGPQGTPVLHYSPEVPVLRAFADAHKEIARVLFAAGAQQVFTGHDPALRLRNAGDIEKLQNMSYNANRVFVASAHLMGGCRMGKGGVVDDELLRVSGYENLHVIDGSVFPTSLGVNPQLTIYALSRLISSRIAT